MTPTLVRDLTAPLASSGAVRISGRRRNWWIESVYQTWRDANDAWVAARESEAFMQWEDDEYRATYPPPRLKDFLIEMSPRRQRDYRRQSPARPYSRLFEHLVERYSHGG